MIPLAIAGLTFTRAQAVALAVAALVGLGAWSAASAIRNALTDARTAAIAERDAHWRAQIADSNARVAAEQVAAARRAADAEAAVGQLSVRLAETLADLERANAALPNADACGLDRDRVRLLPR